MATHRGRGLPVLHLHFLVQVLRGLLCLLLLAFLGFFGLLSRAFLGFFGLSPRLLLSCRRRLRFPLGLFLLLFLPVASLLLLTANPKFTFGCMGWRCETTLLLVSARPNGRGVKIKITWSASAVPLLRNL